MKRSPPFLLAVILALLFALHGLKQPMALLVPLSILAVFFQQSLRNATSILPANLAFIGLGLLFGLVTEVLAILDNWHRADSEKILLHPRPEVDLFFGVFSYGLTMLAWLPLVTRFRFTLREVFSVTAIYGICTEQGGQILAVALVAPWPGIPLALIIGSVYGVFPLLAYMVIEPRFSARRSPSLLRHDCVALAALFLQWAVFGLAVLPVLKSLLRNGT